MVKVVKFGGSSLASAEQFAKVGDIIRADESRKYVVPRRKRNSRMHQCCTGILSAALFFQIHGIRF